MTSERAKLAAFAEIKTLAHGPFCYCSTRCMFIGRGEKGGAENVCQVCSAFRSTVELRLLLQQLLLY